MSWLDKIQSDFIITCGDGRSYTPSWLNAVKDKEYNISTFEFRNLAGTLVYRGQPKGRRYEVDLYFQGDDHLTTAEAFERSADNPGAWTVEHPFYGRLTVQPSGLRFDNSAYNVTRITGVLLETITDEAPQANVDAGDQLAEDSANVDEALAQSYATEVQPTVSDVNDMTDNALNNYNEGKKSISNTLDAESYYNAFNNANTAITQATSEPLAAMRAIQSLINAPALFADNVRNRLNTLANQFDVLRDTLDSIAGRSQKKLYENNAGTLISAMVLTTVTNTTDADYNNRGKVLEVIDTLVDNYNTYITDLDGLQSLNGGNPDSYIPDAGSITALGTMVSFAVSYLFTISAGTRQERSITLDADTNITVLAHRLYGLQPDDSTINELVESNDIGLNELLQLQKGRQIIYYV